MKTIAKIVWSRLLTWWVFCAVVGFSAGKISSMLEKAPGKMPSSCVR